MESKKRCGTISQEQKSTLVNFLSNHPELLSGKFTNEFTVKTAQKLWEELADLLNSIPGAKKDWRQWRKTWQDIRNATKLRYSKQNKEYIETGGGQPDINIQLSEIDSHIINMIKPVAANGHKNILESEVSFEFDNACNTEATNVISTYEMQNIPGTSESNVVTTPHKTENSIFNKASSKKIIHRASDAALILARTAEDKLSQKTKYAEAKLALLERIAKAKEKKNELIEEKK